MKHLTPNWEYVADGVMGGVSEGRMMSTRIDGRDAARLTGAVSLDNNGGFIQMAFDLESGGGALDASAWRGVEMEVRGNGEEYDLRLRTDQLTRPWQSFRRPFHAPSEWTTVRVAYADMVAHKTDTAFDPARLRRIGVLAIGWEFVADVAIASIGFYR